MCTYMYTYIHRMCNPIPRGSWYVIPRQGFLKLKSLVWVSAKVRAQQKAVRRAAATDPSFIATICTCTRVWCAPMLTRSLNPPFRRGVCCSHRPDDLMPILLSANRTPQRGFQFQESLAWDDITHPRPCKTSSVGQGVGLSILRSSVRIRQKLKNLRIQIYMEFSYIDHQARVLNYCSKT